MLTVTDSRQEIIYIAHEHIVTIEPTGPDRCIVTLSTGVSVHLEIPSLLIKSAVAAMAVDPQEKKENIREIEIIVLDGTLTQYDYFNPSGDDKEVEIRLFDFIGMEQDIDINWINGDTIAEITLDGGGFLEGYLIIEREL